MGVDKKKSKAGGSEETARHRILVAAAQIFAERGFAGASLSRISNQSDAYTSLIVHHFGTKENLFVEAVRYVTGEMADFDALFADVEQLDCSAPQAFSNALADKIRSVFLLFHGPDRPRWQSGLLERVQVERVAGALDVMHEKFTPCRDGLFRMLERGGIILTREQAVEWYTAFWAMIACHGIAKDAILRLLGKDRYDEAFLECAAAFIARALILPTGLPEPECKRGTTNCQKWDRAGSYTPGQ